LKEFDGKKLKNCTKEGMDLEETEEEKKRKKKNKKQNLKDYAKLLKKSLVIKLKKLLFQQELKIHHVFWLLVNTAGLPIWKEL